MMARVPVIVNRLVEFILDKRNGPADEREARRAGSCLDWGRLLLLESQVLFRTARRSIHQPSSSHA
jgi:hypothetical protein